MKAGDVVEAEWDDHSFVFNVYGGEGVTSMRSCGYFVRADEDVVVVALSLQDGSKPADVQVIDRRMLRRIRRVRPTGGSR